MDASIDDWFEINNLFTRYAGRLTMVMSRRLSAALPRTRSSTAR